MAIRSVVDNFGAGTLWGVRTDISNATPVKFGVLQEVSVEAGYSLKELIGQNQLPVDVARGALKVTGKAKQAQIYSEFFDLFFGQGVTFGSGLQVALNESHAVPTASPYTVQVTNHTNFKQDLGVGYSLGGSAPFNNQSSITVAGQYNASSNGTYSFGTADNGTTVMISYEYSVASGLNELVLANQAMGSGPTFVVILSTPYQGNTLNVHFNACMSEKLMMPFKNQDFTIQEFDFQAFADANGNLGTISVSQ